MSVPMHEQYAPGEAYPDPLAATGPTRWTEPAADYAGRADGAAPWTSAPEPSAAPPVVVLVTERIGWLTAGRSGAR
jgi:hypothetical protein